MDFKVDSVKQNNVDMVKLTIDGKEHILDMDTASRLGQCLEMVVSLPGELAHINDVFDNWGNGGGESW